MNTNDWLASCRTHQKVLREIIADYYPSNHPRVSADFEITAPAAQAACDVVCEDIRAKDKGKLCATARFDLALKEGNVGELNSLMSSAWFGVPETTSCWHIPGFNEMVNLLDDPPEYDEPDLA